MRKNNQYDDKNVHQFVSRLPHVLWFFFLRLVWFHVTHIYTHTQLKLQHEAFKGFKLGCREEFFRPARCDSLLS